MIASFIIVLMLCSYLACAVDLPTQIHIALAGVTTDGDASTIAVSWNTQGETATSMVRYGTVSGSYDKISSGYHSAYYRTYHHHTVLDTLQPNTKYYYIVGDDVAGWSQELSFVSAPESSAARSFSFFVYGDLGVVNGDPSNNYIRYNKDSVSLVWHGGDVGYADDSFLHLDCVFKFCYENTWDTYMNNIQPWASQLPYMVTPGNHEADCHDPACLFDSERREKLSNFTAYNNRFRMPSKESDGVLNMHYSFNYGNVHFISVDAETGYPGAEEEKHYVLPCGGFGDQLTWLENDLIKANQEREKRPWIFAQGHHPMYWSDQINTDFQKAVEELFYKYGVDIYFAGHKHNYERDYPVYQGIPEKTYDNPRAPVHVLIGGAGNDEMDDVQRSLRGDPAPKERKGLSRRFTSADGSWTVTTDMDNHVGIGHVKIVDDDHLEFQYIRTKTNEVYDSFSLYRDHSQYIKQFAKN